LVRTTYPQIGASVPLMETAARVAGEEAPTDPVAAGLRHHSEIDDSHSSEIYGLLDHLPLRPRHEAIAGMTALQTVDLMIQIGDDMLAALDR
jgi:hypothetical protein